jgi:hypothetical protein
LGQPYYIYYHHLQVGGAAKSELAEEKLTQPPEKGRKKEKKREKERKRGKTKRALVFLIFCEIYHSIPPKSKAHKTLTEVCFVDSCIKQGNETRCMRKTPRSVKIDMINTSSRVELDSFEVLLHFPAPLHPLLWYD